MRSTLSKNQCGQSLCFNLDSVRNTSARLIALTHEHKAVFKLLLDYFQSVVTHHMRAGSEERVIGGRCIHGGFSVAAVIADALDEDEYYAISHLLEHQIEELQLWVKAYSYWSCFNCSKDGYYCYNYNDHY